MNNIETLRHRIRVHIANREHYSKVEFLHKLHEILHESEQTGAQPVQGPVALTYKEVADAMNALWGGTLEQVNIAMEMADKKLYTTPPAAQQRIARLEAELMQMQGREIKLQMALNTPAAQPAPTVQEPVAWGVFEGGNMHDMFFSKEEADHMAQLKGVHAEVRPLVTPPAAPVPLTARELELIDGMIQVQLRHVEQCDGIANRTMAEKQKGWDLERVALLQKIKGNT